jgi:hypothetical protein
MASKIAEVEVDIISNRKRLLINSILGLLFAFSVNCYYATIDTFLVYPKNGDFVKFYMSTKYFWEGKNIYTPISTNTPDTLVDHILKKFTKPDVQTSKPQREILHPNLNPPFQTLILAPLGLLSYNKAYILFAIISLISCLTAVIMISNEVASSEHKVTVLLILLNIILYYFPTWTNIVYGQFSLILLLLITLAWLAAKKGRDQISGVLLGLAMSLKLFVGLFLLFFLVRRRGRLLFWFIGTFLLLSLLPLWILGVETYKHYFSILSSITWYAASWNASFLAFFTRILGGSENVPLVNLPELAHVLTRICSLAFALWLSWLVWPRPRDSSPDSFDLGFSLTITGMFLISPLGWMYYFSLLIIPAVVAWRSLRSIDSRTFYQAAIILAWLLSTVPHFLIPSAEMNSPLIWFTWAGFNFYALLLLSFVLGSLAQRLKKGGVPANMA